VGDAEGDGGVVAFPQARQQGRVEGWLLPGLPAVPGVFDGLVRLAQDGDHAGGPGLQAAGAEFRNGPAAADDVSTALLDPGELAR
jgi:hypothetical protein